MKVEPPRTSSGGTVIANLDELKPHANFGDVSLMNLGGTEIKVAVKETRSEQDVRFDLLVHNQVLDTERYRFTPNEFALIEATSETYDPPLPILKFPLTIGDSWTWEGQLRQGDRARKTTAKVVTAAGEEVFLEVVVELTIDSGAAKPAQKKLSFGFEKGKGLVEREFGFAAGRKPPTGTETPADR